jgi:hypothetical protein
MKELEAGYSAFPHHLPLDKVPLLWYFSIQRSDCVTSVLTLI